MGQFLSPDWSAKVEPVPYSKLDDPQSLNLYAYVGNNPMIRIDADGHSGCGGSAAALCKEIADEMSKGIDSVEAIASSAQKFGQQAGGYFYAKGFKGSGEEIKVNALGVTVEAGHKEGKEVTRHFNGEKEEKEIKSDLHAKVEVAGYSVGAERTMEGADSTPKWQYSGGRESVEGEGGQVGVEASFCHTMCFSYGAGVEAGKAMHDFSNWLNGLPAPGPFSYANK